jgi:hypothetical protein
MQFREGYDIGALTDAANEFLVSNGFSNPNSTIATCDDNTTNMNLGCVSGQAARKLVGVHATAQASLAFLPVIGINSVTISATAVSETASLDVVLVVDRSESMTHGDSVSGLHPPGDPMRDPFYCNQAALYSLPASENGYTHTSACQPFFNIVSAAIQFTKILFFPYDELSIITFDKDPGVPQGNPPLCNGTRCPNLSLNQDCPHGTSGCTLDDAVIPALEGLTVFQGDDSYNHASSNLADYRGYGNPDPAKTYKDTSCGAGNQSMYFGSNPTYGTGSNYTGMWGTGQDWCLPSYSPPPDPSHYTTTNIGAGLEMAGNELATDTRQDVLWVVILLTDGVPNAGYSDDPTPTYFCPSSTWGNQAEILPVCDNGNVAADWYPYDAAHPSTTRPPVPTTAQPDAAYDALAYAFDQADFVGLPYDSANPTHSGQNALIYTIGLGSELSASNYPVGSFTDPVTGVSNENLGKVFLNYAAQVGHGLYYEAPDSSQLNTIFRSIGSDIATRLAK